jgi:hypothetical protein
MSDLEMAAYLQGGGDAARAMIAARVPIACPFDSIAPEWVKLPTFRAYQYKRGFAWIWNCVRVNRGWPDWTEMRLILTPPRKEAGGASEDRPALDD